MRNFAPYENFPLYGIIGLASFPGFPHVQTAESWARRGYPWVVLLIKIKKSSTQEGEGLVTFSIFLALD